MPHNYLHGRPTIGVLAGWQFYRTATNFSYLAPVFGGINRAVQELGCNLLLGCGMGASASPEDPPRPAWPLSSPDVDFVPIGPWNTDGMIIFTPLHSPARSQYVQDLISSGHPVLFIGSGEAGSTLAADNQGGVFEALRHLVTHGHRRIAFIAGSADDMAGDTGERLVTYQAALEAYGLERDPRLLAFGRHVFDGGYSAMQTIIHSGVVFSAVLASNDESALGAMKALKDAGRAVPEDVAVIGFDNRLEGSAHRPSLSSVHVPLFSIGYKAVNVLLQQIDGGAARPGMVRVATRLVTRESCGCGSQALLPDDRPPIVNAQPPDLHALRPQLIEPVARLVMSQAQNLDEVECLAFSERLVDAFALSIESHQPSGFLQTLGEILQRTATEDDDAHIWQNAVSLVGKEFEAVFASGSPEVLLVKDLLDQARFAISAHIQQQHRQHVSDQRWISSRLSLLTANLLTALDEAQIFAILAKHLPVMDIHLALVALFEADGSDPVAVSAVKNVLAPAQEPVRFRSHAFPPDSLFSQDQPFQLILIPLVDQTGQLGYMVFRNEFFDLYGAIVQQLGGALNTARLYRQATEGRRLAEEANRMKSRFLSTISHELRTPLNLIVGLSSLVLRASDEGGVPLPEPTQKDVERIHTYSQHLGGLIGDVIDLATSDAGQLRLNHGVVDLGQALRVVVESGRQLAADKGLAWESDVPESGPWVWGDPMRLRQVALNLTNNAVKFTEHGRVRLQFEIGADSVKVLVSDTGLGISSDEQQLIFNEFRQSERSVALGYGGLGLGLAISKRLVELHGGTIGVYSAGIEGGGSTFFFTLPTVHPPAEQPGHLTILPKNQPGVMVLTNQLESSERLRERLEGRGYKVQMISAGPDSDWQTQMFESLPDAVLLDVNIASDLGWDALLALKSSQKAKSIPVLFYKSSQEDGSVLELDYLTKPIEFTELSRALDQQWLMANGERPGLTILVVDDEPETLMMHTRIVQSHSPANHVLLAHNGREALATLGREPVDLVLLDLQMPEMDGFGVLEAMRENPGLSKIPVIVVTGKVLTEADMARLTRGVATVLEKGLFSLDETVTHISAALERKRKLSGEAQRLVRLAMAYMHQHFADPISRRDIAQHVSIAEDHLTYCFRQELGTTPIEYLHRYRIHQARRLLKETDRAITEIALDVGFSDSGYFSRIFRRITGMAPETFRRS